MRILKSGFYQKPTLLLAQDLLGKHLIRTFEDGTRAVIRILETEAYHQEGDLASHSFNGETERNSTMFGPPGHLYVYLIYGVHRCFNIVSETAGTGAAVLIRAAEAIEGTDRLLMNCKKPKPDKTWLTGPGKLGQALLIDRSWNGHRLDQGPLQLAEGRVMPEEKIISTKRIGISKSQDLPWRFLLLKGEK